MDDRKNRDLGDFIDSVKEVDIKIRDHRADDDFEMMLAGLNAKLSARSSASENVSDEKTSENKAAHDTVNKGTVSAKPSVSSASDKPTEKTEDFNDSARAVPASALLNTQINAPEIEVTRTEEMSEPAEEAALFKNVESVWSNPKLSEGGRVSVNIKTDLRKEIKVTVPESVAREAQRRRRAVYEAKEAQAETQTVISAPTESKSENENKNKNETALHEEKETAKSSAAVAADIRRTMSLSNISVCLIMFFGIAFYLIACERESGFISSENRDLAEKPSLSVSSLLDGSYFTEIAEWYTDTVPYREELKSFSSGLSSLFGVSVSDVRISGTAAVPKKEVFDITNQSTDVSEDESDGKYFDQSSSADSLLDDSSEEVVEVAENLDDGEWMGSVIVSGTGENVRAMTAFYGTFAMGQKLAETINKYADELPEVNVYNMTIPISSAYYMPANLGDQFTSQHDAILNIGSYLDGVENIDVYNVLALHASEYIYARTDHHWMPLGAYYAAEVFAEAAGVDYPALDTYEECRIEDFVGTMYAYSNYDEELNQNPDTFIYYKPGNSYTVNYYDSYFSNEQENGSLFYDYAEGVNCYSAILGTDDVIAEIETDCDNERVLVIFKDSFGNALTPFLTQGFSKIYVCDYRYFDINAVEFCREVGCTDLLFAISIGSAHTSSHIDTISNNRIQAKTEASGTSESSEE